MKSLFSILWIGLLGIVLCSCGNDDDICDKGLGTPRMKVKFKTENNKLYQPDTLVIGVKLTNSEDIKTVVSAIKPDSVLVPLRVDDQTYTDLYIRTQPNNKAEQLSVVRVNYTPRSEYVSPACGIRRLYNDLKSSVTQSASVKKVETNTSKIDNENPTHIYFIF